MTHVYWLEQTDADVAVEDNWLSAGEIIRLNGMRFAKRRSDWRLGRWTAKRAVAVCLHVPVHPEALTGIEICPAPSGAPEVLIANHLAAVQISLSHRAGVAVCAVAATGGVLGCDVELVEPRSDAFVADYFTTEEQALIARTCATEQFRLVALLWSAKESVLKALRTGLRVDTRRVAVDPGFQPSAGSDAWRPLRARHSDGQIFSGWWQAAGDLVRTVVASPPPGPPVPLFVDLEEEFHENEGAEIQFQLRAQSGGSRAGWSRFP